MFPLHSSWRVPSSNKSLIKHSFRFQASKFDVAMFLEDDILLNNPPLLETHARLNMILKYPPKDYKMIYLGYCFEKCDSVADFNTITVKNATDQTKSRPSKFRQHHKSTSSSSSPLLASMSTVSNPSLLLKNGELPISHKTRSKGPLEDASRLHVTYRDAVFPRCTHAYICKKESSKILLKETSSVYSGSLDNMFGFTIFNSFYARRDLVDREARFSIYNDMKGAPTSTTSNLRHIKSNYDDDQMKLSFDFNDLKTYIVVPPVFQQDIQQFPSLLGQDEDNEGTTSNSDLMSNNIISSKSKTKRSELFGPKLSTFCVWYQCHCKNTFSGNIYHTTYVSITFLKLLRNKTLKKRCYEKPCMVYTVLTIFLCALSLGDFMNDEQMEKIVNPYTMPATATATKR